MDSFWQTLLISFIPSIITGIVTYLVAHNNTASQIKIVKEQNRHETEKLIQQQKINIENLKAAHALEMESKEQDHINKLELQRIEFENIQLKQQKEADNAMTMEAIRALFGIVGSVLSTPEGQQLLQDSFAESRASVGEGLNE